MSKDVQGVREFAKQEPRGRVFHAGYRLDNVKAGGSGYGDSRNSKNGLWGWIASSNSCSVGNLLI